MSADLQTYQLTAKTFHGLEKILASEIKKIGGSEIKIIKRAVKFKGDLKTIYSANYLLRTAINILWEVYTFKANSSDELYSKVKEFNWEEYLTLDETFSIDKTVNSSIHTHSHFAALKTKDAIVDLFTEKYKKRPSVNTVDPDKLIHLHISGENCTISLDTSGEALFKRKYRKETNIAPLNEILAAGMVMLSDYKGIEYFYDPMCGSGTILIEAARIFMNIPSGYLRKKFAFQKFSNYDYKIWNSIKREAEKKIKKEIPIKIIGTDIDSNTISIAQKNISNAGLRHYINIQTKDFINSRFEKKKAFFGRFRRPEERPFHQGPPSPRYFEPEPNSELKIRDYDLINLTAMIAQAYIRLLPEICREGDDGEYDLCLERDAEAVKIISRRIHYGAFFVAERKYLEKPQQYEPFIKAKDEQGLIGLITRKQVEEIILQRVYRKTEVKQEKKEGKTVDPNAISNFYRNTIIGLTKEGEIRYLLNRD